MSKLDKLLIGIGAVSAAFVAGAVFYAMFKENADNPCQMVPETEDEDQFEEDIFDDEGYDYESADGDSKDS